MHTSIDGKFIFNSAHLGLFSSANILQIADVTLLETSQMSAIFVFTTKTTQRRPHIVSVNSA